jgi:long-chain acyl-CoA synthetase
VGDRGALDARGFLTLVGRENDMLISGGLNVYPQEIEAVIAAVPGVRAVAVLGLPDARWGQVVAAIVEGDVARDDAIKACRAHLPRAKWPRRWLKIAAMPRTTSGKVARATLTDMLAELPDLL